MLERGCGIVNERWRKAGSGGSFGRRVSRTVPGEGASHLQGSTKSGGEYAGKEDQTFMRILRSSKSNEFSPLAHPERMEKLISGWMGRTGGRHEIRRFWVEIYTSCGGVPCDRCSSPHGTDDRAPKRGSKLPGHEGQLPGGKFGESEITNLRVHHIPTYR